MKLYYLINLLVINAFTLQSRANSNALINPNFLPESTQQVKIPMSKSNGNGRLLASLPVAGGLLKSMGLTFL
ncbi:hypothetical protein K502DRAFT_348124 [Neoconidiobolus thromboides FSU 785]|nr:hypothetical protein K502DRAFT_348124 [Neoconidiobolus thromboides FSU 785]